jgi:hypothetical protein
VDIVTTVATATTINARNDFSMQTLVASQYTDEYYAGVRSPPMLHIRARRADC